MINATPSIWFIVPASSIIALLSALFFYKSLMKKPEGNQRMKEIAQYVREGAMAYLKRQYKTVSLVFVILSLMLVVLAVLGVQNPFVPIAFISGGFFSGFCGFLGMKAATQASSRTANGAIQSLNSGLQTAFRGGAVMGMVVVGFGLLDIAAWYWFLNFVYDNNIFGMGIDCHYLKMTEITAVMLTFGMGASVQALFARVGGGIYTKAADVGADLVGKVEANIPEDDPRNPATIADNVGDNVGDVAGMGADLYESYCVSILATAALGAAVLKVPGMEYAIIAPMLVAAIGILFSLAGIMIVRTKEDAGSKDLLRSLLTGTLGSSVLTLIAIAVLANMGIITWGIFGSVVTGLIVGVIIGQFTEYYTSDSYKPTQHIAEQAKLGHATAIIEGISVGMRSVGFPVVCVVIGIILAFAFAGGFSDGGLLIGLYGIGFASVGMLSTLGITLATDAFGPIADNAGGNAEMSGLPSEVRKRTDELDMLGNTTAATGKGFAIGSAALAAMALLAAYIGETQLWLGRIANQSVEGIFKAGSIIFANNNENLAQHFANDSGIRVLDSGRAITEDGTLMGLVAQKAYITDFMTAYNLTLMNPMLLGGMFIGAMLIFVFSSMTIHAVGRAAGAMVEEVRRQFREIKGIMDGTGKPDYARCVEISTLGAQKEMITPSLMAVFVPILTGLLLGVPGVVGLLVGSLVTGLPLATFLNNSGGAWDNAKKFIEKGNFGGKGSEAHKAAVTGDTVGDPFKDTSGPSLNTLMKLISVVSIVFVGLVIKYSEVFMGLFR
ncbi:MAG: sodium-translocating pyrophosphatase [Fibromonadaceae bacterium]|jgi:K(+)-stimulated pyrophosphate-energized sodium pump|nr:sodium-translocating pyrophosphatase [Fibromonadaceae bacterium]